MQNKPPKPAGAKICFVFFMIGGLFMILLGAFTFTVSTPDNSSFYRYAGSLVMLLGFLSFPVAYGILFLKKWARKAGIILGIMFLPFFFITVPSAVGAISLAILLFDDKTKNAFR